MNARTIRAGDAPVSLRLEVGQVLSVTAPAGSSVYAYDDRDFGVTETITGASRYLGPYTVTRDIVLNCTAGAVSFGYAGRAKNLQIVVDDDGAPVLFDPLEANKVVAAAKNIWLPVSETYGSRTITNAGPIVMASATIPPLTANGRIRISGMWQMDTNAHTRTVLCKIGGQDFSTTTLTSQAGVVTQPFRFEIANYLSTAVQRAPGSFTNQGATGSALLEKTVDTSQEQTLEIVGTVATYALTLMWVNIETCYRA